MAPKIASFWKKILDILTKPHWISSYIYVFCRTSLFISKKYRRYTNLQWSRYTKKCLLQKKTIVAFSTEDLCKFFMERYWFSEIISQPRIFSANIYWYLLKGQMKNIEFFNLFTGEGPWTFSLNIYINVSRPYYNGQCIALTFCMSSHPSKTIFIVKIVSRSLFDKILHGEFWKKICGTLYRRLE